MKRLKYEATSMAEGEILVRGTLDPQQALKVVFEQMDNGGAFWTLDNLLQDVARDAEGVDPHAVAEFGDYLHELLAKARTGYYRKVNCLPRSYGASEGWGWALHPANKGYGAFPAVEFLP